MRLIRFLPYFKNSIHSQAGYSLSEVMIAVAIVSILAVGNFAVVQQNQDMQMKIQRELDADDAITEITRLISDYRICTNFLGADATIAPDGGTFANGVLLPAESAPGTIHTEIRTTLDEDRAIRNATETTILFADNGNSIGAPESAILVGQSAILEAMTIGPYITNDILDNTDDLLKLNVVFTDLHASTDSDKSAATIQREVWLKVVSSAGRVQYCVGVNGDFPNSLSAFHIAFVTGGNYQANFGGVCGASRLCQESANAAGLPGFYGAILGGDKPLLTAPVRNTNDQLVVDLGTDLFSQALDNAINYTETVAVKNAAIVRTGMANDGTPTGDQCNNGTYNWDDNVSATQSQYGTSSDTGDSGGGNNWLSKGVVGGSECLASIPHYCASHSIHSTIATSFQSLCETNGGLYTTGPDRCNFHWPTVELAGTGATTIAIDAGGSCLSGGTVRMYGRPTWTSTTETGLNECDATNFVMYGTYGPVGIYTSTLATNAQRFCEYTVNGSVNSQVVDNCSNINERYVAYQLPQGFLEFEDPAGGADIISQIICEP